MHRILSNLSGIKKHKHLKVTELLSFYRSICFFIYVFDLHKLINSNMELNCVYIKTMLFIHRPGGFI